MIEFKTPLALLLLIPALFITVYLWHVSLVGLSKIRNWLVLALRSAVVTLLVLAIAGMNLVKYADNMVVIYAIDVSKSMDENHEESRRAINDFLKQANPDKDSSGIVSFGTTSSVEALPGRLRTFEKTQTLVGRDFSNVESALALSSLIFPDGVHKRVVLVSDCMENSGDAMRAIEDLKAQGVEVYVHPLRRRVATEGIAVERVIIPQRVKQEEMFDVLVKYKSTFKSRKEGTATLTRDDGATESYKAEFQPGDNVLRIPQKVTTQYRALNYRVMIESPEDIVVEDNTGYSFTQVLAKPSVVIVDEKPEECAPLKAALQSGGIEAVDVIPPEQFPKDIAGMLKYDAVIFSSAPARHFTPEQLDALKNYVQHAGGGFAMLGGDRGFALGGFKGTQVEEILPVKMDLRKFKIKASVATVIIIDRSGSMTAEVAPGIQKIHVANEACARTIDLMDPEDSVCVIYGDTAPHVVIPMTKLSDKAAINKTVRSQQSSGGGIIALPSMHEAYDILAKARAAIKHVILFGDASDTEDMPWEEPVAFAKLKSGEGYTITTVGMGLPTDQDAKLLEDIAAAGGGRFFITEDIRSLPQIFTEDIMVASRRGLQETPFVPAVGAYSNILEGIDWEHVPQLGGYVVTEPKPSAEQILLGPESIPVFAKWQFGLGKTFAFTSDAKARFASEWLSWAGYKKFWTQAVRWLMRSYVSTGAVSETRVQGSTGEVTIKAFDEDGKPRSFLDFQSSVLAPDGAARALKVTETQPGVYVGKFDVSETGTYVASIAESGRGMVSVAGAALPYSPELRRTDESRFLERFKSSGGAVVGMQDNVYRRTQGAIKSLVEMWKDLLLASLILFLLELCVRRLYIPEPVLALVSQIASKLRKDGEGKGQKAEEAITTSDVLIQKMREKRKEPKKQIPIENAEKKVQPAKHAQPQSPEGLDELLKRVRKKK